MKTPGCPVYCVHRFTDQHTSGSLCSENLSLFPRDCTNIPTCCFKACSAGSLLLMPTADVSDWQGPFSSVLSVTSFLLSRLLIVSVMDIFSTFCFLEANLELLLLVTAWWLRFRFLPFCTTVLLLAWKVGCATSGAVLDNTVVWLLLRLSWLVLRTPVVWVLSSHRSDVAFKGCSLPLAGSVSLHIFSSSLALDSSGSQVYVCIASSRPLSDLTIPSSTRSSFGFFGMTSCTHRPFSGWNQTFADTPRLSLGEVAGETCVLLAVPLFSTVWCISSECWQKEQRSWGKDLKASFLV